MAKDKIQEAKKTLAQTLNDITFKNSQVQKIKSIKEGRERLRDSMGRNKAIRVSAASKINELQTLKS